MRGSAMYDLGADPIVRASMRVPLESGYCVTARDAIGRVNIRILRPDGLECGSSVRLDARASPYVFGFSGERDILAVGAYRGLEILGGDGRGVLTPKGLQPSSRTLIETPSPAWAIGFLGSSRVMSVDQEGGVCVFSLDDGTTLARLVSEPSSGSAIIVPIDDELAYVVTSDGVVRRFDLSTPSLAVVCRELPLSQGVEDQPRVDAQPSVCMFPAEGVLGIACLDGRIALVPLEGGTHGFCDSGHDGPFLIGSRPDGGALTVGINDKHVFGWNAHVQKGDEHPDIPGITDSVACSEDSACAVVRSGEDRGPEVLLLKYGELSWENLRISSSPRRVIALDTFGADLADDVVIRARRRQLLAREAQKLIASMADVDTAPSQDMIVSLFEMFEEKSHFSVSAGSTGDVKGAVAFARAIRGHIPSGIPPRLSRQDLSLSMRYSPHDVNPVRELQQQFSGTQSAGQLRYDEELQITLVEHVISIERGWTIRDGPRIEIVSSDDAVTRTGCEIVLGKSRGILSLIPYEPAISADGYESERRLKRLAEKAQHALYTMHQQGRILQKLNQLRER